MKEPLYEGDCAGVRRRRAGCGRGHVAPHVLSSEQHPPGVSRPGPSSPGLRSPGLRRGCLFADSTILRSAQLLEVATVDAEPRRGGVLVASLTAVAPDTARVMELIGDVWPQAAATDTVWTTVLTSYDAIEAGVGRRGRAGP